ncbi:MAG: mechanosensitive ion channel domain-containing protein [Candidatus Margulisiibacteriota bacterium]
MIFLNEFSNFLKDWPSLLAISIAMMIGHGLSRTVKHYYCRHRSQSTLDWLNTAILTGLMYGCYLLCLIATGLVSHYFNALVIIGAIQLSVVAFLTILTWQLTRQGLLSFIVLSIGSISWGLNQVHLLGHFTKKINNVSISVGTIKLTPFSLLKSIGLLAILVWGVSNTVDWVNQQIKRNQRLKSNTKSLLSKTLEVLIYFMGFMIGLRILGIDLTALTVVGGALGVGIGFGLQKITSNFISGIILLFERSIEVDDLIEMDGGIYGLVKHINARYTLIEMFDGKEIMVPNEDFITQRVTNWTYSNAKGRIEVSIGVSYGCDIKLAQSLILEAAKAHPDCIDDPEPVVNLREFGDSSVNFLLFFFVGDVTKGRYAIQSDVMMAIWDAFQTNGIEIPFPQRDIHIKTSQP